MTKHKFDIRRRDYCTRCGARIWDVTVDDSCERYANALFVKALHRERDDIDRAEALRVVRSTLTQRQLELLNLADENGVTPALKRAMELNKRYST